MSEVVRLGDYVERCDFWSPSDSDPEAEFTYIDIAAVDRDAKRIEGPTRIRCADAPSRARQVVKAGDVLVSTVRPNLNAVALVPDDLDGAIASTGFTILRCKKEALEPRYLYQWVKSPGFVDQMVSQATGASYPAVSDRIVLNAEMPINNLSEQRRIAAILDKVDALRAKRREAIAKLDQLLMSLFLEMFGDPNDEMSGNSIPFSSLFADVSAGHVKIKQEDYLESGIFPVIDQGRDLVGGYSNNAECKSPVGPPVIIFGDHTRCVKFVDFPFCVGADGVKVLRPKDGDEPLFLYWWLRLRRIPSAGYSRHYKFLKEAAIRRPSHKEQRQFSNFAGIVAARKLMLERSMSNTDMLFSSLQNDAFSLGH